MTLGRGAIFLDRDGVLVEDVEGRAIDARIFPGVSAALARARVAGLRAVVVTNQTAVARGLRDEEAVREENRALSRALALEGGLLDAFYVCPHHPNATVARYRTNCECRKPRPGMLLSAARELDIDLASSVMIGDRVSDIAAGARAGCRTVLVQTGMHTAAPIESRDGPIVARADFECVDLSAAVEWVLGPKS